MASLRPIAVVALLTYGAGHAMSQTVHGSRQEFTTRLVAAAIERTHHPVRYVSAYVRIPYPGGDVPADRMGILKPAPYKSLIHDGDGRGAHVIPSSEIAAGHERRAHGFEKTRCDAVDMRDFA